MRTISLSQARRSLRSLLRRVADEEPVVITHRGRPAAVMMSPNEYSSLLDTAHVLDNPDNAAHLLLSIQQADATGITPESSTD